MMFLEVRDISKVYRQRFKGFETVALKNINFSMEEGEFIAIMGESGSGKTTLLNLISLLDTPTTGEIILKDKAVSKMDDSEKAGFRRKSMGYIFQDYNLLDTFNVQDNVMLPAVLENINYKQIEEDLLPLAKQLGLENLLNKFPYELSGGQKQRVAVARALINKPAIILADEPTGALDSGSSDELLTLLKKINQKGQSILMVTHSIKAASYASRIMFIKDGSIFHQIYAAKRVQHELYQDISNAIAMLTKGE